MDTPTRSAISFCVTGFRLIQVFSKYYLNAYIYYTRILGICPYLSLLGDIGGSTPARRVGVYGSGPTRSSSRAGCGPMTGERARPGRVRPPAVRPLSRDHCSVVCCRNLVWNQHGPPVQIVTGRHQNWPAAQQPHPGRVPYLGRQSEEVGDQRDKGESSRGMQGNRGVW